MSQIMVSGAAGGIGKELVRRLLARGDTVFATQRGNGGFDDLKVQDRLHAIRMDVGDSGSVTAAFTEIDRLLSGASLDAVVNCAAVAPLGALEVLDISTYEATFNTNALGSLRMMQAAIPRLRGHGGHLVLVTSLWGKVSGPMVSAYAASKHAVEALADSARRETAGMGLHITVAEPGVIVTKMLSTQLDEARRLADSVKDTDLYAPLYRKYAKLVAKGSGQGLTAENCAKQLEQILDASNPRTRYRIGSDAKLVCLLARLLPDRMLDGVFSLLMK